MSLRYKGVPDRGANKQADNVYSLCFCKFVAVNVRLDDRQCRVHEHREYPCGENNCGCSDYRPNVVKTHPNHWPRCVCGHIAQMHD